MDNYELLKILSTYSINRQNKKIIIGLSIVIVGVTYVAYIHYKNTSKKEELINLIQAENDDLLSQNRIHEKAIDELKSRVNQLSKENVSKILPVNTAITSGVS